MSDFDPSTAVPISGFDPSTAVPIDHEPQVVPQPQEQGALDKIGNALGGLHEGIYAAPQNLAKFIAAGTDALGLTHGAHDTIAKHFEMANRDFANPHPETPQAQAGKFAGEMISTLPAQAAGPLAGGALTGALLSDQDTPTGVLTDIATGAAAGKFTDWGLQSLSKAVSPVGRAIARRIGEMRAANPEEQRAVNSATDTVRGIIDSSGKTLDDLRNAGQDYFGKPVTAAEAIGPSGVSHLRAAGIRQGETGNALRGFLDERTEGYRDRALSDLANAAGIIPEAAAGDMASFVQAGRAQAKPLYDAALSTPGPVWNNDLRALSNRKIINQAISKAADNLDAAGIHPGVMGLPSGPDNGQLLPTAQAWDLVKKSLGDMVERDQFGKVLPDSVSPNNRNINAASRDLTKALRKYIPGYGDALDASGDYLSAQAAFDRGGKFITSSNITAKQLADHFNKLDGPERQAFTGGVVNKIFDQSQNSRFLPQSFNKPILQQKLQAVLGPDKANDFLAKMQAETKLRATGQRLYPGMNSPTSEMQAAFGEQDNPMIGALHDAAWMGAHLASGNKAHAIGRALSLVNSLGAWSKSPTSTIPYRDEMGRLLMMSPEDLANHLEKVIDPADPAAMQKLQGILASLARPASVVAPVGIHELTAAEP